MCDGTGEGVPTRIKIGEFELRVERDRLRACGGSEQGPARCTLVIELTTEQADALSRPGSRILIDAPPSLRERQIVAVNEIVKTSRDDMSRALAERIIDAVLAVKP